MPTLDQIFGSDQMNTTEVVGALKKTLKEEAFVELTLLYAASPAALINLCKALEDDQTITFLNFHSRFNLTDEMLNALMMTLKKNQNITKLSIKSSSNANIAIEVARLLKNNQSSLRELTLTIGTPDNARELATALKKNNTLETLNISNARNILYVSLISLNEELTAALLPALKEHPRITHLDMSETLNLGFREEVRNRNIVLLIDALNINRNLSHFSYTHNDLNEKETQLFASLIKENKGVSDLNLGYNQMGCKGAQALADILKKNDTLTNLNLRNNNIKKDGMQALAVALATNSTLTKLDISENEVDTPSLAKALKQNHTLKYLNLYDTKCDIEVLAEALKDNQGLTDLNLGSILKINAVSLEHLIAALPQNHSLTSLGLSSNCLFDHSIPDLIGLLNRSPKLSKLDLSSNKIQLEGFQTFATFLETNQSLTSLDLSRCHDIYGTDIEGIKSLAQSLKKNSTLTELTLTIEYSRVDAYNPTKHAQDINAFYKALDELLTANNTITILNIEPPSLNIQNPSQESEEAYNRIRKALKKNQALADTKTINLISEKIQESAPLIPPVLANIMARYVGPSIPPESTLATPASLRTSPSDLSAVEPQSPHTSAVIPESSSKSVSLWTQIKEWLSEKWNKLSTIISDAWNTFKNKLGLTPKENHISNNDPSNPIISPDQTIQTSALQKEKIKNTFESTKQRKTSHKPDKKTKKNRRL